MPTAPLRNHASVRPGRPVSGRLSRTSSQSTEHLWRCRHHHRYQLLKPLADEGIPVHANLVATDQARVVESIAAFYK